MPVPVPAERQKELIEIAESRIARVHALKPPGEIAFVIIKSENENTVVYQGKYKGEGAERRLDDPAVEVYWIDFAKDAAGGKQAGLNFIERSTAYGMTIKADEDGRSNTLVLAALKEKKINVTLDESGRILALTGCAGLEVAPLVMVYVQMKEKAWIPGVQHIDIVARNPDSGEYVFERIQNKK